VTVSRIGNRIIVISLSAYRHWCIVTHCRSVVIVSSARSVRRQFACSACHWLAVIVVSRHCRLLAWLVAAVVIVVTGLSRSSSPLVSGRHRHCAFGIPYRVSYRIRYQAWWSWPALRLHLPYQNRIVVLGICGHGHISTGWSWSYHRWSVSAVMARIW
jgi:hypothetical protein